MCKAFSDVCICVFHVLWNKLSALRTPLSFLNCLISSWNFHLLAGTLLGTINPNVPFFLLMRKEVFLALSVQASWLGNPRRHSQRPISIQGLQAGHHTIRSEKGEHFSGVQNYFHLVADWFLVYFSSPARTGGGVYPSGRGFPANLQSSYQCPHS